MRKFLTAAAVAAAISESLTLVPALGPVQAQSIASTVEPMLVDAGCARAWPYPRCAEGRLPAQSIRLITTDRMARAN